MDAGRRLRRRDPEAVPAGSVGAGDSRRAASALAARAALATRARCVSAWARPQYSPDGELTKEKRAPPSHRTLHVDAATMPLDDATRDVQAKADTAAWRTGTGPVRIKKPGKKFRLDPGTGVLHREAHARGLALGAERRLTARPIRPSASFHADTIWCYALPRKARTVTRDWTVSSVGIDLAPRPAVVWRRSPALLGRHGDGPALRDQQPRIAAADGQPIAHVFPNETDAVDLFRVLARQQDEFDVSGVVARAPFRSLGITFVARVWPTGTHQRSTVLLRYRSRDHAATGVPISGGQESVYGVC